MINWKDPKKEMPTSGSHVWILMKYPKTTGILSTEIFGVEVHEKVNKEQYFVNDDWLSRGRIKWDLNQVDAWTDKEEISLPEIG